MDPLNLVFLDEQTFNSHLQKFIESKGELEGTGLSLQDIRNMIYTRRIKVDPAVEKTVEKEREAKAAKSTKRSKVDGFGVDDILG